MDLSKGSRYPKRKSGGHHTFLRYLRFNLEENVIHCFVFYSILELRYSN